MKKTFSIILVMLLLALSFGAAAQEVVNVFNWEDYIDPAALELFTEETGIKVNYMRFTTNEDMMVQVRTSEGAFDVVFPSDYCVERLLAEDLLLPISADSVPNAAGLMDWLKNPSYDIHNCMIPPAFRVMSTPGRWSFPSLTKAKCSCWTPSATPWALP
jgi:spermidine/putrescine-binding protein